jgi:hypothetical protein
MKRDRNVCGQIINKQNGIYNSFILFFLKSLILLLFDTLVYFHRAQFNNKLNTIMSE